MPSRKIEQQLDSLSAIQKNAVTEVAITTLRAALTDRVNLIVAKSASVMSTLNLRSLVPDLLTAFYRLIDKGAQGDPQCSGKNALAKALKDLGHDESAPFLRGIEHVQMEPVWGSRVDTAAALRSICVLALGQCSDLTREDKLWHQMRALTDREAPVRLDAARALEEMGGREAALLLRMKARTGDTEVSVTGQALLSLLAIEREQALRFVAEFLESPDEDVAGEAALALGFSRVPAAADVLIKHWSNPNVRRRDVVLRGISATRQEQAFDLLLELVRVGHGRDPLAALDALALHRDSADIRARVRAAVTLRADEAISKEFRRLFPAD